MALEGRATAEGTRRYSERFPAASTAGHFRDCQGLNASSIGLGTYLGAEDDETDRLYAGAVEEALSGGCNVLDTAINYRFQRSERMIGRVLASLAGAGRIRRDEVIVATKGGFIPFDGALPEDPAGYFRRTFVDRGVARPEDIVAGCHIMTPDYLRDQIGSSLANLGLERIDVYYLHNPETQLQEVDEEEFLARVRGAFETLEAEADAGRIGFYGTATWDGYRTDPAGAGHLSLERLEGIAREVAGDGHRFRFLQLPYSIAMPEAFARPTQALGGRAVCVLAAAAEKGQSVMSSASLLQGRLASGLPPELAAKFGAATTDAQRSIQFARSTPGLSTALVGMKSREHVRENLAAASIPPLPEAGFRALFRRAD